MTLVTITSNIAESLKKGAVVPDVLDKAPDGGLITVSYPDYKEVVLGNRLKVADTQSVPLVNITLTDDGQADASYTLVLTDPDAPTRGDEKWSEYCHWVVSGIKAGGSGAVTKVDLGKADELVKYMGPAPPESTGYHRYVFILYKEKSGSKPSAPPDRPTWGTNVPGSGAKEWAEKNGLTAVAVNYFIAQNDKQ